MRTNSSQPSRAWNHAASLLAYVVAGALAVHWAKPGLWSGMCGTGVMNYFMLCELWCGVMLVFAVWECLETGGSRRLALRLALAGMAPVTVPLLVRLA